MPSRFSLASRRAERLSGVDGLHHTAQDLIHRLLGGRDLFRSSVYEPGRAAGAWEEITRSSEADRRRASPARWVPVRVDRVVSDGRDDVLSGQSPTTWWT
jgi:hypothetical protein